MNNFFQCTQNLFVFTKSLKFWQSQVSQTKKLKVVKCTLSRKSLKTISCISTLIRCEMNMTAGWELAEYCLVIQHVYSMSLLGFASKETKSGKHSKVLFWSHTEKRPFIWGITESYFYDCYYFTCVLEAILGGNQGLFLDLHSLSTFGGAQGIAKDRTWVSIVQASTLTLLI